MKNYGKSLDGITISVYFKSDCVTVNFEIEIWDFITKTICLENEQKWDKPKISVLTLGPNTQK